MSSRHVADVALMQNDELRVAQTYVDVRVTGRYETVSTLSLQQQQRLRCLSPPPPLLLCVGLHVAASAARPAQTQSAPYEGNNEMIDR